MVLAPYSTECRWQLLSRDKSLHDAHEAERLCDCEKILFSFNQHIAKVNRGLVFAVPRAPFTIALHPNVSRSPGPRRSVHPARAQVFDGNEPPRTELTELWRGYPRAPKDDPPRAIPPPHTTDPSASALRI